MRLIDADELPKVKFHALPYTHIVPSDLKGLQTEAYERGWNDAIDAIVENAETADVVEVVRCKDCKHKYYDGNQIICQKLYWCDGNNFEPSAENFCSYGERKETENE